MIRKNPSGDLPVIHESAYVDNTAILCGKIIVEENVFIGPYAVIRADEVDENGNMDPIIIGANSNIQDGVVIHSKAGGLVKIGTNSSIAHRSIVHGPCIVGENVFIGFNSVLFDCVIGNGSVVHIPSTTNVHSNHELSKIPQVSPQASDFSESVLKANHELIKGYKKLQNEF
jgi:carbonic anhydrase/acetyltransferase-like protein (isoleucine patch superfamily)